MTLRHWLKPWRHPFDRQPLNFWAITQLAILLLPFSSLLGTLGLLGIAIGVWKQRFADIVRRPVNRGLAVLSLLMLLSTVLALKRTEALLGLFNFLPLFFVFVGLSELIQTPTQLRRLAWLLVVGSVPVVAIGLGQQFFGLSGQVKILWIVVDWTIDPTGTPPGRMASIFFYANVLASYLAITLTLSLGLWVEAFWGRRKVEGRRQKVEGRGQKAEGRGQTVEGEVEGADGRRQMVEGGVEGAEGGAARQNVPLLIPGGLTLGDSRSLFTRLFLTIAVLGNAIALVLTNSRNAWAIAVFACLAYALYMSWRWLLAGVGVVVGSTLGAAFAPVPYRDWLRTIVPAFFWARLTDQLYTDRPVAQLRSTQWRVAWSLAQQHPLTGWGLRNFSPIYQSQMDYFIGHPHNLLLMLAAETGFPAALLFFGLVGWMVVQGSLLLCAKRPFCPAESQMDASDRLLYFSYLVAFTGCALFSFLDITLFDIRINLLGWLLLAAIAGGVYRLKESEGREQAGKAKMST